MSSYKTIHQILPGLFLGGYEPAYDEAQVRAHEITHIVKVVLESTFKRGGGGVTPQRTFPIKGYLPIKVQDRSFERMYPYFQQIATFISDAQANGGVVLVDCQIGISRSATPVLAHLMINHGYMLADAYDHLARIRSQVNPKGIFVLELRMLERDLFGQNFKVRRNRISTDDQGQTHAVDWRYSLTKLHEGWENQEDFTMKPNNEYYDLTTGMYRLVHDKLREAARTDITPDAAMSHLREVICAWFRTRYAHRSGRVILFRILWRALLEQNDPRFMSFMSSEQLSTMLDTIFTSNEFQAFSAIELNAPRYAAELTHMINTWDTITLPSTQIYISSIAHIVIFDFPAGT